MIRRPLLAVVLLLVLWATAPTHPVHAQAPPRETMVMPFDNARAETPAYWLSEGSAVLVADLLEHANVRVTSRDERMRAFERLQLPASIALSHATVIKVGQLVRAEEVIVGSYELLGDRLTVSARAIRLDTGRLLPEVTDSGPISEMVAIYARIVSVLKPPVPATVPESPLLGSPAAVELFVKGLIAETPATQRNFLTQALAKAPDDAVRLALGQVLTEEGQHQRALDTLAQIPVASRRHRAGRYAAARALIALRRYDEAFATLSALETARRSAAVLNALGVVQLRRGGALPDGRPTYYFSQACEAAPEEADYFFNLGYAYWLDRDPQAAIYWMREAVRRDPSDVDAHEVLGSVLQQTGAVAEATRERELARRLSASAATPNTPPPTTEIRRGLERLRDTLERGNVRVDSVIAASGQRDSAELARFHLEAGRRAFAREADREAEQELKRALYLSPYLADAHLLLGRVYLRGGRMADAVDTLKIALWSEETSAAHLVLAEAYVQTNDLPSAKVEVDRALALEPTSGEAKALQEKIDARRQQP